MRLQDGGGLRHRDYEEGLTLDNLTKLFLATFDLNEKDYAT